MFGVFAVGENVFGADKPTEKFDTFEEAEKWAADHSEVGRGWIVRELRDDETGVERD